MTTPTAPPTADNPPGNAAARSPEQKRDIAFGVIAAGGTWQEAADAAGYGNRGTAYTLVTDAIRRAPAIRADSMRKVLLVRLEAQYKLAWTIAADTARPPSVRLSALDRCRATGAELSKLMGLYAPSEHRVQVFTEDAVDAAIRGLLDQFPELDADAPDGSPEPVDAPAG